MASGVQSKFSSAVGLAMLAGVSATTAEAQDNPTRVLNNYDTIKVLEQRASGDRDPDGPEFVVQYSTMHVGDMTFDEVINGRRIQGRAIDCDDMVVKKGTGEWSLTAKFLARSADLADGTSFDAAFKDDNTAVVSPTFITSYLSHIDVAHHPQNEVIAVAGYCQKHFGPSNE